MSAKPDDVSQEAWDAAAAAVGAPDGLGYAKVFTDRIARAIMAAKAEEREACARLAQRADEYVLHDDRLEGLSFAGLDALVERDARIADAIRKRGEA